ncbi:MAG: CDP-diacylglycerol--glycerol-3-phosphate 3-phosphatidyltransferase [Gemmataceae bacterium]
MATVTPSPKEPPVVNVPNILTASRLGMAVVLFVFIELNLWLACLITFALAAFTDWLDGYLARKLQMGSTLGRNLDPLVDKVLVCGAYIFLLRPGTGLYAWMVTVVVGRELIITGLRSFLENKGATFGADWLGKIKMVLQCGALIAIFWAMSDPQDWLVLTRDIFIWGMLVSTAFSGLQYLWKAFSLLKSE